MQNFIKTTALFLLALACVPCVAESVDLTVMSYNIRYLNNRDGMDVWKHRKETVCQTIQQADVVGLQEVVSKQLQEIQASTEELEWYAVGREDGKSAGESTPIGWQKSRFELLASGTFWLSPEPDRVGSRGWDAALPRIASWVKLRDKETKESFVFLNTHFDHKGAEARTESAKLIRTWVQEQTEELPVVVVGDFNSQRASQPMEALLEGDSKVEKAVFADAREVAGNEDPGPNSTWNGFRQIEVGRRIDFILVKNVADVSRFETLNPKTPEDRFASDHLPVMATLRFQ